MVCSFFWLLNGMPNVIVKQKRRRLMFSVFRMGFLSRRSDLLSEAMGGGGRKGRCKKNGLFCLKLTMRMNN